MSGINNSLNFATCDFRSLCYGHKEQIKRESNNEKDSGKNVNGTKSRWNQVSKSRYGNPKDEDLLKEWWLSVQGNCESKISILSWLKVGLNKSFLHSNCIFIK